MKVIKPPHSITKHHSRPYSIFLAGSIELGAAEDWQAEATLYFEQFPDYTILNPRRENWDNSWEQKKDHPQFNQQVNWELDGLEIADKIIMYFVPGTKAPISLLEFGLFAQSDKMLVCCPDGFWRKGNVEIVCERYQIPLFETLEDLLHTHFN